MIYVFDPDEAAQRRNWADFLSQEPAFTESLTRELFGDSLVFAHGSYLNQERFNTFTERNPHAFLIVISGGAPPSWWTNTGRAYWRKTPVTKPSDAEFKLCVQTFLIGVSKNEYSTHLLEPANAEELWALHVLCEAWLMSEAGQGDGLIQKPTNWLMPFDTHDSPGGLFDANGTANYHKFLKLQQAEGALSVTAEDVEECLDSVIKELINLGQMRAANQE